eukprot:TRINITY_DN40887_c0_g1_i1.p1 TRINITY_DN40887_c0_g1~~TRINITY_DN40887_c0_g1_i1.p1  ORF type:complete len:335 (+),score=67.28 TRINITY_DN40887_c0_g1_i1:92-1006(+)
MADRNNAVQKVDDIDLGAIAKSAGGAVLNGAKKRPVSVSLWVVGVLLAAFANGFSVDGNTEESYKITLSHAQEVENKELISAIRAMQQAEDRYYNAKGWFWSCDDRCQKAYDKYSMAKSDMLRVQHKRDAILKEARQEVGIWSVFGVRDVRKKFWDSWQDGKNWAARWTMMDAMFMMIGGKEETFVSVILKIVFQYIVNLTMGLVGSFFFFMYSVYGLVTAYGEPALSGLAFFLLVLVAAMATVGSYLVAIYGTVAGGGLFLVKQAAKHAELEGGSGGRRRQVQYGHHGGAYGGGRVGGRAHYD